MTQKQARDVIDDYKRLIGQELKARHDVALPALGTFKIVERKAAFGGYRVRYAPAGHIAKALRPKAATEAGKALAARLRAGAAGGKAKGKGANIEFEIVDNRPGGRRASA